MLPPVATMPVPAMCPAKRRRCLLPNAGAERCAVLWRTATVRTCAAFVLQTHLVPFAFSRALTGFKARAGHRSVGHSLGQCLGRPRALLHCDAGAHGATCQIDAASRSLWTCCLCEAKWLVDPHTARAAWRDCSSSESRMVSARGLSTSAWQSSPTRGSTPVPAGTTQYERSVCVTLTCYSCSIADQDGAERFWGRCTWWSSSQSHPTDSDLLPLKGHDWTESFAEQLTFT
jgi:hypothetical protein